MLPASIISVGDLGPLVRVLTRAKAGLPITIAGIGGSITAGYVASDPSFRWINLVAGYLIAQFGCQVDVCNAGIANTNSDYGVLRIDRDIIDKSADLVFVDFAVNNTTAQIASYDSLIRRLITSNRPPAIVAIMFSNCNLQGYQSTFIPIAQHYNLPILSYSNEAQAEITAGTLAASAIISPDGVHPPDRGHALAAKCIQDLIKQAVPLLVTPLYPNDFDAAQLISNDGLLASTRNGFVYIPNPGNYPVQNVGALISQSLCDWFSIPVTVGPCGFIWLMAGTGNGGAYGTVYCTVDGNPASVLDFNNGPSGGQQQLFIAAGAISPGIHTLKVQNWPSASGATVPFVWICGIASA